MKYILIIWFCSFSLQSGIAQVKKNSKKSQRYSPQTLLQSAKASIEDNPSQSITDLDQLINMSKDNGDTKMLVEAYSLLGQINEDTGLKELAVRRYDQAIQYAEQLETAELYIPILYRQASLLNVLKDPRAIDISSTCIEKTGQGEYYTKCYEALGIAYLHAGSIDKARTQFRNLEQNQYRDKPIDLSRIQAYQTQIDLLNNDEASAKENFAKSRSNFKKSNATESDYEIVDETYDNYGQQLENVEDEISVLEENVIINSNSPVAQATEQVQLADAYVRQGNLAKAKITIDEAKKNVVSSNSTKLKAEVYKASSEILAQKGQYAQALDDYKKFETQQTALLDSKEQELQKKIALIELQKSIDISENVYSSKKALGQSEAQASNFQRYIIYLLCLLLTTALAAAWWISRSLKAQSIANKQLELKSLRGQMNPHFIFNALNSVNEFIATQNQRKANSYLSQFSKLMRSVLDVNKKDLIPLSEELALTKNYLELEHARFSEKFDFEYQIDPSILTTEMTVPPLLLQPFIENAIWHGLRYREGKGKLSLTATKGDSYVQITISDNGIGRSNSEKAKTKNQKSHKSTGLKNTAERIKIIQSLYARRVDVEVTDLTADHIHPGTKVSIKIADQ